jgi:hypothetical protein
VKRRCRCRAGTSRVAMTAKKGTRGKAAGVGHGHGHLTVSNDLQVMLSEVFANTKSPAAAISSEAAQIKTDSSANPSS